MSAPPPSERRWPVFTLAIIILDLVVAVVGLLRPEALDALAYYPDRPVPWQAITSLFVHANTIHLLGNLVFIAAVGPLVELGKGPLRLALVFVVTGLVGVAAHSLLARGSGSLVGASGAIAGCVGYASVAAMRKRVPIAPNLGAPVWILALIWVVTQSAGAMLKVGEGTGGVSFAAHLGGFLAGLLLAAAFRVWRDQDMRLGHEVLDRLNSQGPAAALAAARAHLTKHPDDVVAHRQAAQSMLDMGRTSQAAKQWWQLAWTNPGHASEAVREIKALDGWAEESSSRRIRLAESMQEADPEAATELLRSVADGPTNDSERPNAILSLALMAVGKAEAQELAAILATDYALHPATETARQKGLLP